MKHMKASLALALSFLLLPLGALAQSGGEDDANRPPKPPKGEKWQGEEGKKPPKPPRDAQPQESSSGS